MRLQVRDHVPALTAVLTAVSLALVFGAVLEVIPTSLLPRASDGVISAIPHVNAGISLLAIAVIAFGWRSVRQNRIAHHRASMVTGLGLFVAFLALYLYKVALEGPTAFPGPDVVYRFVYLPLLAVHMLLAVVCVPLLYYVLLLAVTRPVAEIPLSRHPRVGRVAAGLWLTSFALGFVTYLLLYVVY